MSEGQFVDFATLEDWEMRDREKTKRLEALEAKLAKAVGALERIQDGSYGKSAAIARTALSELKGEADE